MTPPQSGTASPTTPPPPHDGPDGTRSDESSSTGDHAGGIPAASGGSSGSAAGRFMTSFVCNFRIKPDATEDQVRLAVAHCMHPPMPGLINFKILRAKDGRYLERFNFDSIESMKFAAETMNTTRKSPSDCLRSLMDTENCVPTVWMGPAQDVPTPLWPPGLGDDEMDSPATPRSATPPMSSTSSSSSSQHRSLRDLAADLLSGDGTSDTADFASSDVESVIANASVSSGGLPEWGPAWQALSAGGQRTIMHMLNYWMPPHAASPPSPSRPPHLFDATFTTVLRGTPSWAHNAGPAYAIERPVRDRSAPRFRYQHPAYDAQPRRVLVVPAGPAILPPLPSSRESPTRTILALRETTTKDKNCSGGDRPNTASISPPPVFTGAFGSSAARPSKRQTFCAAIVLEAGLPARCKCDTGVCAAPAVGDRILVRLTVNGAVGGGESVGGLRAARVTAISSWSKKRAAGGNASAVHPLMQRAWIGGSDDEHHRTMVEPQAAAALGAARAAAVGLPMTFEDAWCFHDLSCVVIAVRTVPLADVPRAQLLGMLEVIAREVYRTSGTPVEWVPHSRVPPA